MGTRQTAQLTRVGERGMVTRQTAQLTRVGVRGMVTRKTAPVDTRRRAGNGDSALAARLSPLRFRRSGLVARVSPLGSRRSALAARLSPLGSLGIQIWRIDMTHCLISLTLGYYISVSRLCVSIDHISAFSCLVCASEELRLGKQAALVDSRRRAGKDYSVH